MLSNHLGTVNVLHWGLNHFYAIADLTLYKTYTCMYVCADSTATPILHLQHPSFAILKKSHLLCRRSLGQPDYTSCT